MTVEEGFRALLRKHAAEDGVGVGQRHHEQRHRDRFAFEKNLRLSEIDLGLGRRVAERHEHLRALPPPIADHLLHGGVPARVLMLALEALMNANGGVMLLAVNVAVLPQDLLNDRQERPDLPLLPRLALPIAGRLGVRQYLLQRVPMNVETPAHASPAASLDKHQSSNLGPLLHVRKHP